MLKEAFNLEAFDNLRNVLILILMEHAQRADGTFWLLHEEGVLILILMEHAQRASYAEQCHRLRWS